MNSLFLILLLLAIALLVGLVWLSRLSLAANRTDWGSPWVNLLDGLNLLFCTRYHRLSLVELPLPDQGAAVVVANHISGLDPLLMIACSRRPLRFLIAREQYQRFGLQWLFRAAGCIPVDRERSPEKALRQAFNALRDGEVVALFPYGKIHLDSHPPRRTKAGASRLALITKAPVIPLYISGIDRQGHVISSVFFRAKAKVDCLPVIEVTDKTSEQIYEEIERAVNAS
ncbi:MAG: 1-acyl-sn-glycerol-3-phosphate acyltransferase [Candidatus Thiodiazotropha sp. (ex Myrtea spinifera)]|nr:1-acyl-sn-glycerol-3-phosphate acyltransferase [Candidatus Thiodiazotropha sp. (ex Myrtea spinifera)]